MSRTSRRRLGLAVRFALALGLLALAIRSNRAQLGDVFGRRPDLGLFALGFAAYLCGVLLAFLRWYWLVRAVALPFRVRDALRLGFIGALFNFVIPGAVGGDFVKAAYLSREQGRTARSIASVIVDRLAGLEGLFLLALVAGWTGWGQLDAPLRRLVTAAAIAMGVTSLVLGLAFVPLPNRSRSKRRAELAAVGASYRSSPAVVVLGVALGCLTHVLNVLAFYAVSRALFPSVPSLADHLLIVPLVLFTTAIPLPFGALGVTEQVSARMFLLADSSGGAVAMMAFRLLQLGGALIGGLVYLANASQVRDLARTAHHLDDALLAEVPASDPESNVPEGSPAADYLEIDRAG
jgi:uncharacterized membrane protein YbhN (UPF0104 family)